jgi:hypothetical protein
MLSRRIKMKLNKIVLGVMSFAAAVVASVNVFAATDIKTTGTAYDGDDLIVPVIVTTTDTTKEGKKVSTYALAITYDTTRWTFSDYDDPNTYGSGSRKKTMGTVTYNDLGGKILLGYSCNGLNGNPTITDGEVELVDLIFTPVVAGTEPKASDFVIGIDYVDDENVKDGVNIFDNADFKSYFEFEVSGLEQRIVGLYVSTDGGVTKQELTKYTSVVLNSDDETVADSAKFVVSVNNTQKVSKTTDITVYGETEDGQYVPLTSYDQNDFMVQTFEYNRDEVKEG